MINVTIKDCESIMSLTAREYAIKGEKIIPVVVSAVFFRSK
jgi:hypothetical protein